MLIRYIKLIFLKKMMTSIKYLILYFSLLNLFFQTSCYLIIPLTYFPVYKYNNSSPTEIITNIIFQKVYANIKMGTPSQDVQIPLSFDSNEFYISDNPKADYDSNKFNELKFYDAKKSSTFFNIGDEIYSGYSFDIGFYSQDIFYFNNQKKEIQFYNPLSFRDVESGGLGMKLEPYTDIYDASLRNRSFFEIMKKNNFINAYDWSIFYNNTEYKKEEEGFLLLGCLPHEVDSDLGFYKKGSFDEKYLKNVSFLDRRIDEHMFKIDKIIGYYGKNKSNLIDDFPSDKNYLNIELDYNLGGIQVPKYLMKYYEKSFENYLDESCYIETLKIGYNYFYCKKEDDNIEKIKEKFPGVIFQSEDLNYSFIIEADDLFIEEENYVFCLIYFNIYTNLWKMGKPFLRKYPFSINYNDKIIKFYNYIHSEEPSDSTDIIDSTDSDSNDSTDIFHSDIIDTSDSSITDSTIPSSQTDENKNDSSVLIIGLSVGLSIIIIVLILFIVLYIRKKYKKNNVEVTDDYIQLI